MHLLFVSKDKNLLETLTVHCCMCCNPTNKRWILSNCKIIKPSFMILNNMDACQLTETKAHKTILIRELKQNALSRFSQFNQKYIEESKSSMNAFFLCPVLFIFIIQYHILRPCNVGRFKILTHIDLQNTHTKIKRKVPQ